ncbi:MAG: response regulator [Chloroflexi bacterium]|nr:response regulator [Chloroflexota bacterium]
MRILYLEDDQDNLALIGRVAHMHGDELVTVETPDDALAELQIDPFDLIIVDIALGPDVMDGLEFAAYLRDNGLQTPIIAITAYDFDEYRHRSAEIGTQYHIVKPVAIEDLVAVLDEFRV